MKDSMKGCCLLQFAQSRIRKLAISITGAFLLFKIKQQSNIILIIIKRTFFKELNAY